MHYLELLRRLHDELRPAAYLEIGVESGDALQLSRTRSVAIGPNPQPRPESLLGKPRLMLFVGEPDGFFREQQREAMLGDAPLDLAFIDGLHEFAQVIRDLENIERWGHAESVVAIHDVLPRDAWEAAPQPHDGFWTGDVWRVVPFLRLHRPDLRLWLTAAEPTGMLFVTGLDPSHPGMADLAAEQDDEFLSTGPAYNQLVDDFIASADPAPAETVLRELSLGRRLEREWEYASKWGMRLVADDAWNPLLEAAKTLPDTPRHDWGMRASLRLIGAFWLPHGIREQAYVHLARYSRDVAAIWPGATCRLLTLPGSMSSTLSSPGPVVVDGTLMATIREASARGGQTAVWRLLDLDDDFAVVDATPLRDETGVSASGGLASIERLKPFADAKGLRATVAFSFGGPDAAAQPGLIDIADGACRNATMLNEGDARQPERDWAPLTTDDGLRFVCWWQPTEVWDFEPVANRAIRAALLPAPRLAERFDGASAGVEAPGGYLFLINEDASEEGARPARYARFVFMRRDFRLTAVSPHFWVAARGEDIASGLTRRGEDLIAGFTSQGRQAVLARIPLEDVMASLIAVDSPGFGSRLG